MFYGGKIVLVIVAILTLLGFATGNIALNRSNIKCFGPKHWTFDSAHKTWFSIGALELRYQPVNFDCAAEEKLDATKFELKNGEIVPKMGSPLNTPDVQTP